MSLETAATRIRGFGRDAFGLRGDRPGPLLNCGATPPTVDLRRPARFDLRRSEARRRPMTFNVGSSKSKVGSQAKYGPTADLNQQDKQELLDHYGVHGSGKTKQGPLDRLTQY